MFNSVLPFSSFNKMSVLITIICVYSIVSISCAPHLRRNDLDNVIVDDETLWSKAESPEDKSKVDSSMVYDNPKYQLRYSEVQNHDSKHDATTTFFQKWGFTDKEIPKPFGSSHIPGSVPEFKGQNVPGISKNPTVPNETNQLIQDKGTESDSTTDSNPSSSSALRYKNICEEGNKVCIDSELNRQRSEQLIEIRKVIDDQVENKFNHDIYLDAKALSESHAALTKETIIEEDTKAIDHIINEIKDIFEQSEEQQFIGHDKFQNGMSHLLELTNLIHEMKTIAISSSNEMETSIVHNDKQQEDQQDCHCPDEHKSLSKPINKELEITSRNEDMIIRHIQKTAPPHEATPQDVGFAHLPPLPKSMPVQKEQIHTNEIQMEDKQKFNYKLNDLQVDKNRVKDISNIIVDVDNVAKLERENTNVESLENNVERSDNLIRGFEPGEHDDKVKTLGKVIQDIHKLDSDSDSEANINENENKERLDHLIEDLQNSKSPGDIPGSIQKLQQIIKNIDKDSELEYQLQQKLHQIIETGGQNMGKNGMDDVINDLDKLTKKNLEHLNYLKFTKSFDHQVTHLEEPKFHKHIWDLGENHKPGSFNGDLQKLKKHSKHHDNSHNRYRHHELDEDIRELEKLVHKNYGTVNSNQINRLNKEIQLLTELNNSEKRKINSRQKEALDNEIMKIQHLAENKENLSLSNQRKALDDEIKNLEEMERIYSHKLDDEAYLQQKTALDEEIRSLEELADNQRKLSAPQKQVLHNEIKDLKYLEDRQGNVDSTVKLAIDKEIEKIEALLRNLVGPPPPDKFNEEIKRLHNIAHQNEQNQDHLSNQNLELLNEELIKLETLVNENRGLFDQKQHKALDEEIVEFHIFADEDGDEMSYVQVQPLDDVIARIDELTSKNMPQLQKHEAIDLIIRDLHKITHQNEQKGENLPYHNLKLLNKEINYLENLVHESHTLFDKKQHKAFDEEIAGLHLFVDKHSDEISYTQIQAMDNVIDKIKKLTNQHLPQSKNHEAVDEIIKHLHDISHTFSDHKNLKQLDEETQQLELLTRNENHGVMNYNQKKILKEEIEQLHNVHDINPEQIHTLDNEIKKIDELAGHPVNMPPNKQIQALDQQIQALDQGIKQLQYTSHIIQGKPENKPSNHYASGLDILTHNVGNMHGMFKSDNQHVLEHNYPNNQNKELNHKDIIHGIELSQNLHKPGKANDMVESLESLKKEVDDLETKKRANDVLQTLEDNINDEKRHHQQNPVGYQVSFDATGQNIDKVLNNKNEKTMPTQDLLKRKGNLRKSLRGKM